MPNISFKIPSKHVDLLDEVIKNNSLSHRGKAVQEAIFQLKNEIEELKLKK